MPNSSWRSSAEMGSDGAGRTSPLVRRLRLRALRGKLPQRRHRATAGAAEHRHPPLPSPAGGGPCRYCRAPISWRYPIVEAATGGLFLLALARRGLSLDLVSALVLLAALVAITGIDLDHQIIPDVITLPR